MKKITFWRSFGCHSCCLSVLHVNTRSQAWWLLVYRSTLRCAILASIKTIFVRDHYHYYLVSQVVSLCLRFVVLAGF